MPTFVETLLADYGLLAILVLTFFEGETVVIIAGFLSHEGYFNPYTLCLAAFLGTFAGDQAWFYLGRRHANFKIVQKVTTVPQFARVIRLIETHPIKFILSFRFVYGIRNISPVALGLSRISALKYFILNGIAAAVWAVTFTSIGYFFGQAAETFIGRINGVFGKLLAAAIVGLIVYFAFKFGMKQWAKVTAARRARAAAAEGKAD
jgi:membrane protein DedA with SNARE-associated domain